MTTETVKGRTADSLLRKANNRERIALCKLERLKARFDRLYDDLSMTQAECEGLKSELGCVKNEKSRLEQEAAMWRAQLFERMEILDQTRDQLGDLREENSRMREDVEKAQEAHRTNHKELKRRDRERKEFEQKIEELQMAERQSKDQSNELLDALTDANRAIDSLQRQNDYYQREIDGLKAIGASLTESLTKLTQQRDQYKHRLESRGDDLRLEQAQAENLLDEVERLKDELYETRCKLVTLQIEGEMKELRRAGAEKADRASEQKFADFPNAESAVIQEPQPRSLLWRASKKVSGWFRISDDISSN